VRVIAASLVFFAAAFALAPEAGGRGGPRPRPVAFGINAQRLFFELPERAWSRHFALMAAAGIHEARVDALWQAAEPRPPVGGRHAYRWHRFDALVAALARHRIRWVPVVAYSTTWAGTARGNHRSPPRDPRAFAAYAGALARRYGRGGSFWRLRRGLPRLPVTDYEIWNAPNGRATAVPASDYALLYLAARRAIRSADPRARAWVGGLAEGAPAYIRALYRARPSLRRAIDAVALHPYAERLSGVLVSVVQARRALDRLGMSVVPLVISEIGWATAGRTPVPHASDAGRARLLALLAEVLALSDCDVVGFFPHTWTTRERDPVDSEDWFGLWHPNGMPTIGGTAYAGAARRTGRWLRDSAIPEIPLCGAHRR
jgi:hypothetical protein